MLISHVFLHRVFTAVVVCCWSRLMLLVVHDDDARTRP
jgi:hypothetical protein